MSLLPAIVGLRFSYVSLAPRLLHIAAPGIVLPVSYTHLTLPTSDLV